MPLFPSVLALSSLDGSNGYRIDGAVPVDHLGSSVASAGDVNGDGLDDLIVGAELFDAGASNTGAAYVVYGRTGPTAPVLDVSSLDGGDGFTIPGPEAENRIGHSVSSAGDINGDGLDDLAVIEWAPFGRVSAYVVFGRVGGLPASVDLASLDGTDGFEITNAIGRIATAGDVNRDGFDDLLIGNISSMGRPAGSLRPCPYPLAERNCTSPRPITAYPASPRPGTSTATDTTTSSSRPRISTIMGLGPTWSSARAAISAQTSRSITSTEATASPWPSTE